MENTNLINDIIDEMDKINNFDLSNGIIENLSNH